MDPQALSPLLAGLLTGAAVLAASPAPRRPVPRPRRAAAPRPSSPRSSTEHGGTTSRSSGLAAAIAAVGVAVAFGGWPGLVLGLLLGASLPRLLARLEPAAARRRRMAAQRDLPVAADLLAGALAAGVATAPALAATARAVGGPLGEDLTRVAADLALGGDPRFAWSALGDPTVRDLVAVVGRSLDGGAELVPALQRLAVARREASAGAAEAAARRAGVLAVLPLGLCFLPAFVLLAVVPVAAGLLGRLAW